MLEASQLIEIIRENERLKVELIQAKSKLKAIENTTRCIERDYGKDFMYITISTVRELSKL